MRELHRAKGTAREKALAHLERRDLAFSMVRFQHDRLGGWVLFNVHFAIAHAALFQKMLGAPAVGAPTRGV